MEESKVTHKFIDQLISDVRNKWHAEFSRYDPAEALKKLKAPTLAVLSSADDQVILVRLEDRRVARHARVGARAGGAIHRLAEVEASGRVRARRGGVGRVDELLLRHRPA